MLGSTAKLAMPLVVFNEMNWFRALSCTPPLASATSSPLPPAGALFCVERKRRATPEGAWLMTASSQKPPGSPSPVTAANFVFISSPVVPPERNRPPGRWPRWLAACR